MKTVYETKIEKRTVTQTMMVLKETIDAIKLIERSAKRRLGLTEAVIDNLRFIMELELEGMEWKAKHTFDDKGNLKEFKVVRKYDKDTIENNGMELKND